MIELSSTWEHHIPLIDAKMHTLTRTNTHTHSSGMFTCWGDLIPACLYSPSGEFRVSQEFIIPDLEFENKKRPMDRNNWQADIFSSHVSLFQRLEDTEIRVTFLHRAVASREGFLCVHVHADAVHPHPSVLLRPPHVNGRPTFLHKQHGTNVLGPRVTSSCHFSDLTLLWLVSLNKLFGGRRQIGPQLVRNRFDDSWLACFIIRGIKTFDKSNQFSVSKRVNNVFVTMFFTFIGHNVMGAVLLCVLFEPRKIFFVLKYNNHFQQQTTINKQKQT